MHIDVCGDERVRLAENGRAEEVRDNGNDRKGRHERHEKRELVDVLEHDVVGLMPEMAAREERKNEVGVVPVPPPQHANAVDRLLPRAAGPPGRDERDTVPPARKAREDFVEMHLRPARLGVSDIAPVQGEYPHRSFPAGGAASDLRIIPSARSCRRRPSCRARRAVSETPRARARMPAREPRRTAGTSGA